MHPSKRPHPLILANQCHQLGTKYTKARDYEDHVLFKSLQDKQKHSDHSYPNITYSWFRYIISKIST